MVDPWIEYLDYGVAAWGPQDTTPLSLGSTIYSIGVFSCSLAVGQLRAYPQVQFSNSDSAKEIIEARLVDWVAFTELTDDILLRFYWRRSRCVERDPNSHAPVVINHSRGSKPVGDGPTIDIYYKLQDYHPPALPVWFHENETVHQLRVRQRDVRHGKWPLLPGAYWILTKIETRYGGRRNAARTLNVDPAILDMLGLLTALNDPMQGRKAKGEERLVNEAEQVWIRTVLPRLVLRVAEAECAAPIPETLKMNDFS